MINSSHKCLACDSTSAYLKELCTLQQCGVCVVWYIILIKAIVLLYTVAAYLEEIKT